MTAILGDVGVMTSLLFGGASTGMRDMIRQGHEAWMNSAPGGWSRNLIERSNQLFESFNGAGAIQLMQNALSHVKSAVMADTIYEFRTITQFQTAQPMMQEYIMAHEATRRRYHANLCDGYSDTYVDKAPGIIGLGHRAYEQAYDGIVHLSDEKDKSYYESFGGSWVSEDSQALTISQQAALMNTYAMLDKIFLEEDRDPTSPWNASL